MIKAMIRAALWAVVFGEALIWYGVRDAHSWEFAGNPDRFPSIGFNTTSANLDGHRDEIDGPTDVLTRSLGGSLSGSQYSTGGDVRLPVSNALTISFSYDSISNDLLFTRSSGTYRQKDRLSGNRFGFGARLYLR